MVLVEETTFLGQRAVRASNGVLSMVIVPAWGSNLISLVYEPAQAELLRVPASADAFLRQPVLYGTPVLFPPNRIAGGRFVYRGRTYQFDVNEPERGNHLHGFVYNRPWELVYAGTDEAGRPVVTTRFDLATSPERDDILRQFPHHFVLTMRFILDGATLRHETEVNNAGSEPFPFGLGFHTTFVFPENGRFALTAAKRWRLDERLLPTGDLEDIPFGEELRRGITLAGVALDDAFFVGEAAGGSTATLSYPIRRVVQGDAQKSGENESSAVERSGDRDGVAEMTIRYEADSQFRHWVVYNAHGRRGFVCPEPYTWITNAPNLNLPPSLTGLQELQPGERRRFTVSIRVAVDRRTSP